MGGAAREGGRRGERRDAERPGGGAAEGSVVARGARAPPGGEAPQRPAPGDGERSVTLGAPLFNPRHPS